MFKNPYKDKDIDMPEEVVTKMTEAKKFMYYITALGGVLYLATTYGIVLTDEVKIQFPIIYIFHELWLFAFPLALIILLLNQKYIFYRTVYFRFTFSIVSSIFFITIILFMILTIFTTNPSSILVNSIYLSHLALFLFYFTKYLRFWNSIFSGEEGEKYALKIKQYKWRADIVITRINTKEVDNHPFYTKAFEKVGNVVVASGFILPTIFAMSATGTGGSIPIMVVELFVFLIAPFAYNLIAKGIAWYLFIRRLEKEKNVIIYNGVWLT